MKIYSMTATFGKLEHQTLTLQPGLNIIEAPNEWGKSTWCAFLVAMLYGIETRTHTTKTVLSDKERYAPWSGSPMAGRVDLNWNGRDITIERRTKGRSIMGVFRAYETATGLDIPELTAANCGQQLLGVERSVFLRAGFLRLTDLPVTQDESLRRRLNALVTTGDESGAADKLAQKLRDLKNRCRFNRSGLLPQAEAQRDALNGRLQQLYQLQDQSQRIQQRQIELESFNKALLNHHAALTYAASQETAQHIASAAEADQANKAALETQEALCRNLPSQEEAQRTVQKLHTLHQQSLSLQMDAQMLPPLPQPPAVPTPFLGMDGDQAATKAEADAASYEALCTPARKIFPLWIIVVALMLAGAALLFFQLNLPGFLSLGLGATLAAAYIILIRSNRKQEARLRAEAAGIAARYGTQVPADWVAAAHAYRDAQAAYRAELASCQQRRQGLDDRFAALKQEIQSLCGDRSLLATLDEWKHTIQKWDDLADIRREQQRSASHLAALQKMSAPAAPPEFPDHLDFTKEETAKLLSDIQYELRQLQLRLGQCLGQMEHLGHQEQLIQQLNAVNIRIGQLEDTYAALVLAQQTLEQATAELQRRFAPRISQRAQTLFGKLTQYRYTRLTLGEDLRLQAGTEDEDTLRPSLWRSDGTVDQLYLALRLAVAQELTPDAPLILDDALVRFDDARLRSALEILKEEAQNKQVILFTCQGREQQA